MNALAPYRGRTFWHRLRAAAAVIARLQARIVLTLVYGVVVLPTGLIFRLVNRQHHADTSGWTKRAEPTSLERPF